MFRVVPFKAEHLAAMKLQALQMHLSDWVSRDQALALEESPSYTALVDDVPVGAAGIIPMWTGRAVAWAFFAKTSNANFLKCHQAIKRFLNGCYVQRIEMTVDCAWPAAHRWARLLGFHVECERMKHYSPDGGDCALYVRILP